MSNKLTPWFPSTVKPVHEGVYQKYLHDEPVMYSKWNGGFWCAISSDFNIANLSSIRSLYQQEFIWRGLAQDPSKGRKA